jgi:Protein of unknown function, DUF488
MVVETGAGMTVEIATCSYSIFQPFMGVPVCTSLGRPKFPISYELTESVGALKPWGLIDKSIPAAEFSARYRARLDKVGTATLSRIFHAISRKHGRARLVLLCFERPDQPCHRRTFADWWTEQTGQEVPELAWIAGADGTPWVCHELSSDKSAHRDLREGEPCPTP